MKNHRRGKQYIDPEVQGALARRLISHWVLFLVAALTLTLAFKKMVDPFVPTDELLAEAWWCYGPLFAVLLALAPVFIYDSIRLSNRFSGPVFRIRQAARQLAAGETPERVEFRDSDFWKQLAADFNVIAERLQTQSQNQEPSPQQPVDC